MNVSLTPDLRELVDAKITRDRYSSASEYVRELIREDMKREARETVDSLLLKSLASKKRTKVTPAWKREKEALIKKTSRSRNPARS